jgi:hypothetical protein
MELELEGIQAKIDDRNIKEETRMELRAAIEVIRDSHYSRSASVIKVLNKRRLESWRIRNSGFSSESENLFRTKLKFIGLCDSIYLLIRRSNLSSIWVRSRTSSRADTMRWTFETRL